MGPDVKYRPLHTSEEKIKGRPERVVPRVVPANAGFYALRIGEKNVLYDVAGMLVLGEDEVQVPAVLMSVGRQQVRYYHGAAQRMVAKQQVEKRAPPDLSRVEGRPLAADEPLRPVVAFPLFQRDVEETVVRDGERPDILRHG